MAQYYLAKPPGSCCLQAVKHTGTPTGNTFSFGGIPCYVTGPTAKEEVTKVIFHFCDVYGTWYLNNKLVSDFFAQAGYTVIAPDYFSGDELEHLRPQSGFDFQPWAERHRAQAGDIVRKVVRAVKEEYDGTHVKYAALGYCFGGRDVLEMLQDGEVVAGAPPVSSRLHPRNNIGRPS